jgi:hypothetical protein
LALHIGGIIAQTYYLDRVFLSYESGSNPEADGKSD